MWAEVRKAAESTTNQNKNTTKEIEKESVASKQAVAFAEKNQERIGSVPVQVGDFEVGMEMVIDGVLLTVESNDGETVLLSDGEQFGKQSLSVENDVWLDVDDSSFFGEEDIESEANQIVDEAEKQGYQSPDDFIAANPEPTFQQEGDSAANAGNGGNASSENGSVPPQDGQSQVKRPASKMDVKNADSRELFADDGGFKLGQDNTVDGAKIAAERKANEDAKAAADAAQGDMFGEKAKPTLTPDEQALKDAFSDMVDGLEAAPLIEPDPYQSKGIPRDKRATFMDVADQLYDAGVRTPADLAAKLEKVGGGKLRAYSDAVWSVLRSNYPTLPQASDWAGVYSKINDSNSNDSTPSTSLEPDSSNAGTPNGGGKSSVPSGRGSTRGNGKRVVSTGSRSGNSAQSNLQPNDGTSAPERDGSDQQSPESTPEPEERPSNPDNADGSRVPDADGVEAYGRGENDTHDGLVIPAVAPTLAQGGIEGVRDVVDVKKSAPALKVEQAEDVVFVEKRFEKHPGALLTNGTGTGKTFSGLGVVKRALDRGEKHVIIIAPSDKVVNDWIDTAREFFGIRDIAQLDGIRDNSATNRVVVTTYANFGQNNELVARPWGLVVTDEAHYLAQAKDGNSTLAQKTHKGLTWHPKEGVRSRLNMELAEEMAEMSALNKSIDGNNRLMNRDDTMDQARYAYQEENRKLEARYC
jgi:hypothetical protein